MKVHIDEKKCQGHTMCQMTAPEVFALSEIDGHAIVVVDQVPEGMEDDAMDAVYSCPEEAITTE